MWETIASRQCREEARPTRGAKLKAWEYVACYPYPLARGVGGGVEGAHLADGDAEAEARGTGTGGVRLRKRESGEPSSRRERNRNERRWA